MRYSEAVAKLLLESIVPGATMHYRDDGRPGMYDFDLCVDAQVPVPMEVTMATDEVLKRTTARLLNQKPDGELIPTRICRKDWLIAITKHADIRRLRAHVDRYLSYIEELGFERFVVWTDGRSVADVRRIHSDLGVEAGWVTKWKRPGLIGVLPPSPDGGWIDPIHVNEAVLAEAEKPDNLSKLGSSPSPERHLFVLVELDSFKAWSALNDQRPGETPLILPPPLTVAWVAARTREEACFTVWTARSGQPWASCGIIDIERCVLDSLAKKECNGRGDGPK